MWSISTSIYLTFVSIVGGYLIRLGFVMILKRCVGFRGKFTNFGDWMHAGVNSDSGGS